MGHRQGFALYEWASRLTFFTKNYVILSRIYHLDCLAAFVRRSFCWAHMSHFDVDQNGKIIDTSKISLDHYQFLPAFMLMVCTVFIGVEIFWWVGEIERVPFHVDYFINCLEDAFEEFGRTLLLERNADVSKAKTGTASFYFRKDRLSNSQFIINEAGMK